MRVGRRGGKSVLGGPDTQASILERGTGENCTLIMEPTYSMIRSIVLPYIYKYWPSNMRGEYNKTDHEMEIHLPARPNGLPECTHMVYFRSATRPERVRGIGNICTVWLDEVAMYDEELWKIINTGIADQLAPVLMTSTPKFDVGTVWFKELCDRCNDPAYAGTDVPWEKRYVEFHWTSADNPYLLEVEYERLADEYGQDSDWFRQEILGEFVEGGIFIFGGLEFTRFQPVELNDFNLTHYITIDPAYTEEDLADRAQTAINIAGIDPARRIFIVENVAGYWSPQEQIDLLLSYYNKYKPRLIGLEKNPAYHWMERGLFEAARKLNISLPIIPLAVQNKKKVERAQSIPRLVRDKQMFFPDTPDGDALVNQMRTFPLGRYADRVDTLSLLLHRDMGIVEGFKKKASAIPRSSGIPVFTRNERIKMKHGSRDDRPTWAFKN